jgi:hypothetical protein
MMAPAGKDRFIRFCGLTCVGGSEQRGCNCTRPDDCLLKDDPEFDAYRGVARQVQLRVMKNVLSEDDE